jgi:ABC-type transporter Mla MlaB component
MNMMLEMQENVAEAALASATLSGEATVADVEELKLLLVKAFSGANEVNLDLGGVLQADAAVLQLIHSARMTAKDIGSRMIFSPEPSVGFLKALSAAGFCPEEILGINGNGSLRKE